MTKRSELWSRFEKSGRLTDYLAYRRELADAEQEPANPECNPTP